MKNIFSASFLCLLFFTRFSFAAEVKVMTYNIRYDNADDGINQWPKRTARISVVLQRESPDILGVQEALANQVSDLEKMLAGYSHVGVGRDDGKEKGEFSAIFFKKDKFKLLDQGTFWLSPTPEVPGSKGWDAAITRVCTWAKLEEIADGHTFIVFNTHFDHMGKVARSESARLVLQKIMELPVTMPVVLTGDLNSEPSEEAYYVFSNNRHPVLNDSFSARDLKTDSLTCTFTGFSVKNQYCKRIDYIFSTAHFAVVDYHALSDNDGANYCSDHLPVVSRLKWEHR